MRIAFVIIATTELPWRRILSLGQEGTWLQDLESEETYIAAYSDGSMGLSKQDTTNHQKIFFPDADTKKWSISQPQFFKDYHATFSAPSGFGGIIPTTISAIKHLRESWNPDYIIRTNVSSYWNMVCLRKKLESLPRFGLYAGVTGPAYGGITGKISKTRYVSGAGIVMSNDVADLLVDSWNDYDLDYIDDLSIGRTLAKKAVSAYDLERTDVRHLSDVSSLPFDHLQSSYHFRCKSEYRFGPGFMRRDVSLMEAIAKRLNDGT
jgi:hypothetical protein